MLIPGMFGVVLLSISSVGTDCETAGRVAEEQKLSAAAGFVGQLDAEDMFGVSLARLSGHEEPGELVLAIGAFGYSDDDGIPGAVWIATLASDGDVTSAHRISSNEGGFVGTLQDNGRFGRSVASIDDLNGDGFEDLAVGAFADSEVVTNAGAVWILFLGSDGVVIGQQKISVNDVGSSGDPGASARFGVSVAHLGDLNQDGFTELAVGADYANSATESGEVWILSLDSAGQVVSDSLIRGSDLASPAEPGSRFGAGVCGIGDVNGDGHLDIVASALRSDGDRGAAWILFLDSAGTPIGEHRIASGVGGFQGPLAVGDWFGTSVCRIGDLEGDGLTEIAIGANMTDDETGAVWILTLGSTGEVLSERRLSRCDGGFDGVIDAGDLFGTSLAGVGDINGDGVPDLGVGAPLDDDGASSAGAAWLLTLRGCEGAVCDEDLDLTGDIGFADLLSLLAQWGPCASSCSADLDCDGDVGFGDLVALLGNWGACR